MISSTCRIMYRSYHLCNSLSCFTSTEQSILKSRANAFNLICARFMNDDIEPIDVVKAAAKKHRTKTAPIPKITLLDSTNNIIGVTTKEEAEKMAEHKKFKLVKIIDKDLRTKRPIYRLMTDAQILQEELARKSELRKEKKAKKESFIKGEKVILLSANITKNDFEIKLHKTEKWVAKQFEVRLVISGNAENTTPQEALYKEFEKTFQGKGRLVQKRIKSGDLKFQILPNRPEKSESKPGSKSEELQCEPECEPEESKSKPESKEPSSEDESEVISNSSKI